MKHKSLPTRSSVGVILALTATVVVNALASIIPINGMNTGEIANQYDIYFFPANYVFSIWSVIYLGLFAYAIYQLFPAQRTNERLQRIAPLFMLNMVFNSAWIVLWHYNYVGWSVLVMLGILVTLICMHRRLQIGSTAVSVKERLLSRVPFSIYLGWISVATVANVSVLLFVTEWSAWGLDPTTWSAIMMVVATVLASLMLVRVHDIAFAAVVVWALIGIAVRYPDIPAIRTTVIICCVFLVLMTLFSGYIQQQKSTT